MRSVALVRAGLAKAVVLALVAVFLLPLLTWSFTDHVLSEHDAAFREQAAQAIASNGRPEAEQAQMSAFYDANPPSAMCGISEPELAQYQEEVCPSWEFVWQFSLARQIAVVATWAGVATLLGILLLGLLAFRNQHAQLASLIAGWRLLSVSSAFAVVAQSSMLGWLSFWLPAYYLHAYSIKVVVVLCAIAGLAAIIAVVQIFASTDGGMAVEGELVPQEDAPHLWERVRVLAAKIGTAPPDQIVAGIDANFFVTQADMQVHGHTISGRTLFVSLPLLRVLDKNEADAVLAHELGHLCGGDTAAAAALGPKLVQFDTYCMAMRGNGLTNIAFFMLDLYRLIFELALTRASRAREFAADKVAANVVNGSALVRALIKVAGYSSYRNQVETELFAQQSRHEGSLGIANSVAQGLHPFALSDAFMDVMKTARVPHPFDTHPNLAERMANVASAIHPCDFGSVLVASVESGWAEAIDTASAIELRLWSAYEARFAQAHEHDLAYRYLPANETELAIVEKFFPVQVFDIEGGKRLILAYDGVTMPADERFLAWDSVTGMGYEDGLTSDTLRLTIIDKDGESKTYRSQLAGISGVRETLKSALANYWHRNKVARGVA